MDHERALVDGVLGMSILLVAHFHPVVVAVATHSAPVAARTTVGFGVGGGLLRAGLGIDLEPDGAVAVPGGIDVLILGTIEGTVDVDTSVGHLPRVSCAGGEGSLIVLHSALRVDA